MDQKAAFPVDYNHLMLSTPAAPASILIVDDEDAVSQTFARLLRLEGYAVRTAMDVSVNVRSNKDRKTGPLSRPHFQS